MTVTGTIAPGIDMANVTPATVVDCCLFSVVIEVHGGIHYTQSDRTEQSSGDVYDADWKGAVHIPNAEERKRGMDIRRKALAAIGKIAYESMFGYLARNYQIAEIEALLLQSQTDVDEFNSTSQYTHLVIDYAKFSVDAGNERAIQSIKNNLSSILEALKLAMENLDVTEIRKIITKMRNVENVFDSRGARLLGDAREWARKQAMEISRRLKEVEDNTELVQKEVDTSPIDLARFAFIE